jgi:hypothetical protein
VANGLAAIAFLAAPVVIMAAPASNAPASSGSVDTGPSADDNAGTVKLHPVGPCPDQNAEQQNHGAASCDPTGFEPTTEASQGAEIGTVEDVTPNHVPHLPCENIEVLGTGMADESGNYEIDSWPPSGRKEPVYGRNTSGASVLSAGMSSGDVGNNGTAAYSTATGGLQVMDIIDVDALVHNAIVAGADAHPVQGYHFKVQFNQGTDQKGNARKEQKHKTFWVHCNAPDGPSSTPSSTPNSTPSNGSTPTPTSTPSVSPSASPEGSPTPGVTPTPTGSASPVATPGPDCGLVMGTIVLAGTTTLLAGGSITETGHPTVTSYPSLLDTCESPGVVQVSATPPPGYTMVGAPNKPVTVVAAQVTNVVFQATKDPSDPGTANGAGTGGRFGVLGASTGMPLTGMQIASRAILAMACFVLGTFLLRRTRRARAG